jgi:ATP-dependent Clp protease ATP-binding subunit ClpC
MFNDLEALLRIDMSEYMESHSVSKMIGSPPGYVGHDDHGGLTEQVRRRPYSVILLDEIEKANAEVFNILLQVLDSGHLTDAKGRKVNFKNTVIIMTSNIGAEHIDRMSNFGFADDHGDAAQFVQAKDKVMESLKSYFRPEFLNRLDEIITFDLLTPEVIADIVKIQVQDVIDRLEKKEIKLTLTKEVYDYLATEGYDARYGARPLKRLIQSKILTPVANNMVGEGMVQGGTVKVSMKKVKVKAGSVEGVQAQELDFDIKKKGRTNLKKKSTTKAVTKKKREKVAA